MMLLLPQKNLYQILVLRRKQCVVLYNPVLLNQGLVDFGYKESRGSHMTIIFTRRHNCKPLETWKISQQVIQQLVMHWFYMLLES